MRLILASKSGVRKKILDNFNIDCDVITSNVDEDEVKISLQAEGADPLLISKNLAEIKSVKVSIKNPDRLVLGADSVISLKNKLINIDKMAKFPTLINFFRCTNHRPYITTSKIPFSEPVHVAPFIKAVKESVRRLCKTQSITS